MSRRHSSGRFIRHLPPERACELSRLCSTEDASSGTAARVRPTDALGDASALRASRCTPAVWERPAPPFRSARVVVGLCDQILCVRRYAWPLATLPNGLRHPGKARGRGGRIARRSLLPLFLIALALAGCAPKQESEAISKSGNQFLEEEKREAPKLEQATREAEASLRKLKEEEGG